MVNIQIVRVYTKLTALLMDHKAILHQLEKLENKVFGHDESFKIVFDYLRESLNPKSTAHRKIGFKQKPDEEISSRLPSNHVAK